MELGLDNQFKIDPRTKIILLVIISFMVFNEAPLYVSGILVLVPFICLFFSDYKKRKCWDSPYVQQKSEYF